MRSCAPHIGSDVGLDYYASTGIIIFGMEPQSVIAQWQYSRRKLPGRVFSGKDFAYAEGMRFRGMPLLPDTPLISGRITQLELQEGMSLHCVEGQDLYSNRSSLPVGAGLHVVVVLEGKVRVAFGGKWLELDAEQAGKSRARGALISIREDTLFEREWVRGKFERKISVRLSADWLHRHGLMQADPGSGLARFTQEAVAMHEWTLSTRMVSLVERIFDHASAPGLTASLVLQSSACEIVHEALLSLEHNQGRVASIDAPRFQKIHKVRDFLDNREYCHLSVQEIAQIVALSQSTLQRQFKTVFGVSVDAYRREARLKMAHHLLEKEGLSVSQVADRVGYTSAANFSTAFKRHYGVLPKAVRSRI